jgi:DNA-binding response OmpR family regulator
MPAQVLVISGDTAVSQKVGLALDDAGLGVTWCSFAPGDVAENLRDFKPTMLLVQAEVGSPQLATLLARVESTALPVVLLCRDASDARFVKEMRTGIVELLEEPFSARAHVARLKALSDDLGARSGELVGQPGARELSAFIQHLMRTRRTGGLQVGEHGRAHFVRGVLKAARFRELAMQEALAAMTREQAPWRFHEGLDGEAASVFVGQVKAPAPAPAPVAARAAPASGRHAPIDVEPAAGDRSALPVPEESFASGSSGSGLHPAPAADKGGAAPQVDPDAAKAPLLLVDDDPAVVAMLGNYFAKKGYPVSTAADGVEAAQLMATKHFELVIVDLNMPRLDGWGFLKLVRDDLRSCETPVAFYSAQDNYRESLRLLHTGAQAYFPKTMRLTALEAQVKELLEPRRRFVRLIDAEGGLSFALGQLGPQWVLRALTVAGFSGQVDAKDAWATWRLWFERGRLVQCTAKMGGVAQAGDRALAGFIQSRTVEGSLSRGLPAPDEGFGGQPTAATLARVVTWLNDEQRRAQEAQLARARGLEVNEELYRLFLVVGPPAWQPMARMLCEQRLPPAEVMARLQVTPAEVAAVVRELIRRGIASVQA